MMILQRHIQKKNKLVRPIVILLTAQYVDVNTFYILCKLAAKKNLTNVSVTSTPELA